MKKFSLLILLLTFFIALPSYANQPNEKNNFIKMRKRFEKIDKNSDGLLSKEEMIEAHYGDPSLLHKTKNPYQPRSKKAVIAKKSGFVTRLNTKNIGWVVNDLTVLDEGEDRQLDHSGGVRFEKKLGDEIQSGETLAVCHGKYQGKVQIAAKKILSYIEIGDESVDPGPVIL